MTRTKRVLMICAAALALAFAAAGPATADDHLMRGLTTPEDDHATVFPSP